MSKLDWTRSGQHNPDPARFSSDSQELKAFRQSAELRKEFAVAKAARSKAARKAAKTRKMNRELEDRRAREAEVEAIARRERDAKFFAEKQASFAKRNAARRAKLEALVQKPSTNFGQVLSDALQKAKND